MSQKNKRPKRQKLNRVQIMKLAKKHIKVNSCDVSITRNWRRPTQWIIRLSTAIKLEGRGTTLFKAWNDIARV